MDDSMHNTTVSNEVDRFMAELEHPLKPEIEVLRTIVRNADERMGEGIKWNAPSFFIDRHFATFKLYPPGKVQVVLHTDAKKTDEAKKLKGIIADPDGLLKWAADDRCVVTFSDMEDVRKKEDSFSAILKEWIAQTQSV